MALACGHDAPAYGLPVCEHIRTATDEVYFSIHYTGHGLEHQRICALCREEAQHGRPVTTGRICEDCSDTSYGSVVDSVGRPETIDASRPVPGAGPLVPFPADTGTVLDLAPTERGLLLLAADGRILLWDAEAGSCTHLATTCVSVPADAEPWNGHDKALRLHASRNGRFAAVAVDFGRTGEVIDLTTGASPRSWRTTGTTARPSPTPSCSPSTPAATSSCTAPGGTGSRARTRRPASPSS
ncbi:hypothetical protein ACM614_07060 [Streptomyces sp. 12297]